MTFTPDSLDDPRWLTAEQSGMMDFTAGDPNAHGHQGIRTISGLLDILHHVTEEGIEELEHWARKEGKEHELPPWLRRYRYGPHIVAVSPQPADYGRWLRYPLTGSEGEPTQVLDEDEMRVRALLWVSSTGPTVVVGSVSQVSSAMQASAGGITGLAGSACPQPPIGQIVEIRNKQAVYVAASGAAAVNVLNESRSAECS